MGARWHRGATCCELDVEEQRSEPVGLRTESECPSNPWVPVRAVLDSTRDHRVPKDSSSWGQLTGAWLWRTGSPNAGAREPDMRPVIHREAR